MISELEMDTMEKGHSIDLENQVIVIMEFPLPHAFFFFILFGDLVSLPKWGSQLSLSNYMGIIKHGIHSK